MILGALRSRPAEGFSSKRLVFIGVCEIAVALGSLGYSIDDSPPLWHSGERRRAKQRLHALGIGRRKLAAVVRADVCGGLAIAGLLRQRKRHAAWHSRPCRPGRSRTMDR